MGTLGSKMLFQRLTSHGRPVPKMALMIDLRRESPFLSLVTKFPDGGEFRAGYSSVPQQFPTLHLQREEKRSVRLELRQKKPGKQRRESERDRAAGSKCS